MTGLSREIARLFTAPGDIAAHAPRILRAAAAAHRELLHAVQREVDPRCCPPLTLLATVLPQDGSVPLRFLCDPVLIEGLHELADCSDTVHAWHECTADPVMRARDGPATAAPLSAGPTLGNVALAAALRADPYWCGRMILRTDCFGLLRFPLTDWSLLLSTAPDDACLLSKEAVLVHLTRRTACFAVSGNDSRPIQSMPRALLVRLIARNDPSPDPTGLRSLDSALRSTWQRAAPFCPRGARFLPVHCDRKEPRGTCGAVVQRVHDQLQRVSPAIHHEFCRVVDQFHGFQLAGNSDGVVQSFSEPTRPRIVGFNVPLAGQQAPCCCPFAVTSLGHEMAHTKMYLIGSIGWQHDWRLLNNPGGRTGVLPRYGRSLGVRTLCQIPYTHLYEWTILMDGCDAGMFADSPFPEWDDVRRFGDDLQDEIAEAFAAVEVLADLTPHGIAAMAHFQRMFQETAERWDRLERLHDLPAARPISVR